LWAADHYNNRVLEFSAASLVADGLAASVVLGQTSFTASGGATTQSGLSGPSGLASDSSGNIWVADNFNSRVLEFLTPSATPTLVNSNLILYAPYTSLQRLVQANVSINGKAYSANFYEGVIAQYGRTSTGAYGYLGYYQGIFGAISGCQQGYSITVWVTYNGISQSSTVACPAYAKSAQVNITITSQT
jgi:hypothetical protein